MKSIKLPGMTLEIGKGQPEYNVIHAMNLGGPEGEIIACYELTDDELKQITETKRIYYHRLTFGGPFQPMRITTELGDNIQLTTE